MSKEGENAFDRLHGAFHEDKYDEEADVYDKDMIDICWEGPKHTAEAIIKYTTNTNGRILDLCAGTGAVGKILRAKGYDNLDFLDGSKEMTRIALTKKDYKRYVCQYIYEEEETIIGSGLYDTVAVAGGHISPGKLRDMLRVTKKGGVVIMAIVETGPVDVVEAKEVFAMLDKQEEEGKFQKIEHTNIEKMLKRGDGSFAPGYILVLRK